MPLGEPKSRWKENTKMDFRKVAQKKDLWRTVVSTVMNFWLVNSGVDEQLLGSRKGHYENLKVNGDTVVKWISYEI
jgi:hypothetical protein